MSGYLAIGVDRPLVGKESWTDLVSLILVFCLAFLASVYLLSGRFNLEAHISDIQAAIYLAASQTIEFVSIDTSDQPQATHPATPDPHTRPSSTVLQPHTSSSASLYSASKPHIPAQWVWERSDWAGRPGEFSQRKLPKMHRIFKTKAERAAWYEALAKQPQRRAQEYENHLYATALQTPLPKSPLLETSVPEFRREREPLCVQPGYDEAYKRFSAIFRQPVIREEPALPLPPPPATLPPAITYGAHILPYDLSSGAAPSSEDPPIQSAHTSYPMGGAGAGAALPQTALRPPTPTAAPTQADIIGTVATPGGGDAPVQAAPGGYPLGRAGTGGRTVRFDLPPPSPAPVAMQSGGSTTSGDSSGGDPPAQASRPTLAVHGSLFGDVTTTSSTNNELMGMSPAQVHEKVKKDMVQIELSVKTISNWRKGTLNGWKEAVGSEGKRASVMKWTKNMNDLCDWATGSNGTVDESKIPRSDWPQWKLEAAFLTKLQNDLQAGSQHVDDPMFGDKRKFVQKLFQAADRLEKLFR